MTRLDAESRLEAERLERARCVCVAVEPSSFELTCLGTRALGMHRRKARRSVYVLVPLSVLLSGLALAAWMPRPAFLGTGSGEEAPLTTPRANEDPSKASGGGKLTALQTSTRPSHEVAAPPEIEGQRTVVRLGDLPNEPQGGRVLSTPATVPSDARARWTEVSRALHEGQTEQAQKTLEELERDPSAETRDAATLARIQLQVSRSSQEAQSNAELETRLAELARDGATPMIRRRAERLLSQLSEHE